MLRFQGAVYLCGLTCHLDCALNVAELAYNPAVCVVGFFVQDAEGEGQEATGEVGLDELMQGYSNVLLTDDQLGMIRRKKQPKVEQPRAVAPPSVAMKPTM